MVASSYEESLRRLLVHEGGYTNHPSDPGGPTNFGITIYDYRKYVKRGATAADVKAMRIEEAKRIYRAKYWDAQRCDELPAGVDDCVFDYGVNSGIGRAKKVLQRLVGVKDDGALGPLTMAAVARRDPAALINAICDERLRFLRSLRTWPVFGRGWTSRVAEVRAFALQLAKREVPSVPASAIVPPGKGEVPLPPVRKAFVQHGGKIAVAGGTAGGVGAWSWLSAHPLQAGALVVAGIVLIAGAIAALNRRHERQQQAATPGVTPVPVKA